MKLINLFKQKEKKILDFDDKEKLDFVEKEAYFKEALRLARDRGIRRAREDYENGK